MKQGTHLLQNQAFVKLWLGSASSNLADGIGLSAAPLLAATLTRDPALVAGLSVAQQLPWFLLSLISGVLVDRLDRRLVLVSANLLRSGLFAILAITIWTNWLSLPYLYITFFVLGTTETLVDNAAFAILPAIIQREQLEQANGRLFATSTIANEFAGPPVGSTLFALLTATPFVAAAGAYSTAAVLLGFIRGQYSAWDDADQGRLTLGSDIIEAVRWFWNCPLLPVLSGMAGAINFFFAATFSILVLFAQDILGIGEVAYGFLLTSSAIGGILGSLVADSIVKRLGPGRTIFVTNLLPGAAYLIIASTTSPVLVGAMLACGSFASMLGNIIIVSFRQAIIPDHLLGRVTSVYRMAALGALPLGALFGGFIARTFGLAAPYWIGGITLIVMAFALLLIVSNQTMAAARENLT